MIAIASTAAGILIFGQRSEPVYEVVDHEFPLDARGRAYLPTTEGSERFLLSLYLSKPVSMLAISFGSLRNLTFDPGDDDPAAREGLTLEERAANISSIREALALRDKYPVEVEWPTERVQVQSGDQAYTLIIFDFSNASAWAGEAEGDIPLIHGALFDEAGNITGYFQGSPGFLGWPDAIHSLTVKVGSQETKYAPLRKGTQQPGTLPLDQAPELGGIQLEDLGGDTFVTIDTAVEASLMGLTEIIHLIRIEINGDPQENLATLLLR
jgi:hypothetical protein